MARLSCTRRASSSPRKNQKQSKDGEKARARAGLLVVLSGFAELCGVAAVGNVPARQAGAGALSFVAEGHFRRGLASARARQRRLTFASLASDSEGCRRAYHFRLSRTPTGRGARRNGSVASIARSGLRCVAHDLGLGVIQLLLAGRLDIASALQAERALRATRADAHLVILDLREGQFIGYTATRVALMADARARRIGGRFALVAARAPASRFFALARLHRRREIVEQFPRTTVQEVPV